MPEGFQSYRFSFADVCPSLNEVLEFMQSSDCEEDHPVTISAKDILDTLSSYEGISGGYIIKDIAPITPKTGIIEIDGVKLQAGSQICGYVKQATKAALFICTAGDIFTRLSGEYNRNGLFLEAFVADSIGSLTVENAMDRIQDSLSVDLSGKGLKISNRYSPGYCNWPLSGQKELFGLIGENATGVLLSESCLINPIKSVSGIIGIGTDIKKREYGCSICNNAECIYRKIINKK